MKYRVLIALLVVGLCVGVAKADIIQLDLMTDTFGSETSFAMLELPSNTQIAYDFGNPAPGTPGPPTSGLLSNTAYLFNWNLAPGSYNFVLGDSFGDGGPTYSLTNLTTGTIYRDGAVFGDGNRESTGFRSIYDTPEPATLTLLLLGAAGAGVVRRRRRRA